VIHNSRGEDRRRAILEQVDLARELAEVGEQVVDRPGDAMALRLARDDDRIEREQVPDKLLVAALDLLTISPRRHLRAEDRVVRGERVPALDLVVDLALPRDRVEEDRLFDGRDERVPDSAQHGVVGPDGQLILASLLERSRVVEEMLLVLGRSGTP